MGFRSMGKMRAITPELKSIQDRYKNDRQKLSSEMMALIAKVNPLGGCFPLLASFPFYSVVFLSSRESLELRHAPFAFWLTDLSARPLLCSAFGHGLTHVFNDKIKSNSPNADPTQMMVMKFMPVGISIIFIFFPSGLVLYSVANSGIQLIQQTLLYRGWWFKKLKLMGTIFALATPVGQSPICVFRVTGQGCLALFMKF